jgi:exonuclease V gamma subunit
MFGFFKKRSHVPTADELRSLTASARADVKGKWVQFNQTIHLSAEVPLSQKIDFFAQPVQQFFQNKYPILLVGASEIFWLTVFTAILESGTHPKEEINAAIAELKNKYGRS